MTTLKSALDLLTRIANKDEESIKHLNGMGFPVDTPDLTKEIRAFVNECTARAGSDEATRYAESLAVSLSRHFPDCTEWKPLTGDLIGLLTQIDNMSAGLGILLDQSNASLKKAWQENFDLRKDARAYP